MMQWITGVVAAWRWRRQADQAAVEHTLGHCSNVGVVPQHIPLRARGPGG